MRALAMWVLLAAGVRAEIRDVMKRAEVEAVFQSMREPVRVIHRQPAYSIEFRVVEGKPAPRRANSDADELWFIRGGGARLSLAEARHDASRGDVVFVPRGVPAIVDPGAARFEYVAVCVIPAAPGPASAAWRKFYTPRRMPDLVNRATIEETIATRDSNQPLHAAANFTVNYVIYQGRRGPWEAHRGCVDIYLVYAGSARARLGGDIANAKEETPGEIRGDGVSGARESTIGPGDIVLIPRNGAHHMDPGAAKLGYLLVKVWAE